MNVVPRNHGRTGVGSAGDRTGNIQPDDANVEGAADSGDDNRPVINTTVMATTRNSPRAWWADNRPTAIKWQAARCPVLAIGRWSVTFSNRGKCPAITQRRFFVFLRPTILQQSWKIIPKPLPAPVQPPESTDATQAAQNILKKQSGNNCRWKFRVCKLIQTAPHSSKMLLPCKSERRTPS